jgi:hypothetical protein
MNRNSSDDSKISKEPPVENVAPQNPTSGIIDWSQNYHIEQLDSKLLPGRFHKTPELRSTAHLITEDTKPQKRSSNWNEWYQRVCQTIYDLWLLNSTGPGKAWLSVTVWPGRDIEGRIMKLESAADEKRDGKTQKAFADSALRAVHSLGGCSLLDFPTENARNKVTFQLDITRLVGGESGYEVIDISD